MQKQDPTVTTARRTETGEVIIETDQPAPAETVYPNFSNFDFSGANPAADLQEALMQLGARAPKLDAEEFAKLEQAPAPMPEIRLKSPQEYLAGQIIQQSQRQAQRGNARRSKDKAAAASRKAQQARTKAARRR